MSNLTSFQLRPLSAGVVVGYPSEGVRVDALIPAHPELGVHAFGSLAADDTGDVLARDRYYEVYTSGSRAAFDFGFGATIRPLAASFDVTPTLSVEGRGRFTRTHMNEEPLPGTSGRSSGDAFALSAGVVAGVEGRHLLGLPGGDSAGDPALYWQLGAGFYAEIPTLELTPIIRLGGGVSF